jgi:hypothetical protein
VLARVGGFIYTGLLTSTHSGDACN